MAASWLWSNPEPSNNTLPALQSQFKVDTPSISGLVAAILQERARAQKQKSDELNSLISGVGSVASGLYGAYEGNKSATGMADYLQQARTAQQSGTPGGFSQAMSESLQGMSPQDRLKMMEWQFQQDRLNQSPQFYQDQNGNTVYNWGGHIGHTGTGHGVDQLISERRQQIIDTEKQKRTNQEMTNLLGSSGAKPADLPSEAQLFLKNADPANPNAAMPHSADSLEVKANPSAYEARFPITDKAGLPRQVVVPAENYIRARELFKQTQQSPDASAALGAAPAQSGQTGPPPGTPGMVNGIPAHWDGRGWVADE